MSDPDVLVTGASGHLGYALMVELPKQGFAPIGIDIVESEVATYLGSITDRAFLRTIFDRHPTLRFVLHTASLHKPQIGAYKKQDFIDTNIQGTLALLEESSKTNCIDTFVFASTTSAFGAASATKSGQPAAWIDEHVVPKPKDIYGVTKIAAEDICKLIHEDTDMPVVILKISRFFPEQDSRGNAELICDEDNLKVCELMYRRVDVADVVTAHIRAMEHAQRIRWGKFIISAPQPFQNDPTTLKALDGRASDTIKQIRPEIVDVLLSLGWTLPRRIDRVYDPSKAIKELKWEPIYTFERALQQVSKGKDWRSSLAQFVGERGYRAVSINKTRLRATPISET